MSAVAGAVLCGFAGYRLFRLWAYDDHPWIVVARTATVEATTRRFGGRWAYGWTCGWCAGTVATAALAAATAGTVGLEAPWLSGLAACTVCGWLSETVPR